MKTGDIFKLDAQALVDTARFYKAGIEGLREKAPEGSEWAIAKSKDRNPVSDLEVRSTRMLGGKPQRGKPRRFPRFVVARLLGLTSDPSLVNPPETLAVDTTEAELPVDEPTLETVEAEDEKVSSADAAAILAKAIPAQAEVQNDW